MMIPDKTAVDNTSKDGYKLGGDRLTIRENVMAILQGEQPDCYFDMVDSFKVVPDPDYVLNRIPRDGKEHKERWGVVKVWPDGAPGAHPLCTPDKVVLDDVLDWEEKVVFPDIEHLDWTEAKAFADSINRSCYFPTLFMPGGLFERSHFLMGMEDAFCAYLEEPEAMSEMLSAICDWKIRYLEIAADKIHPDLVHYQDDWGSKINLFLPPSVWREMIKPLHAKIVKAAHDLGMVFVHHADCFCQIIASDMAEMGIDAWQGVIPQNDILQIQKDTDGKLAIVGGLDTPLLQSQNATDDEVRAAVRKMIDDYCPAGKFFPAMPTKSGFSDELVALIQNEINAYGHQWAAEHPVE